MSETTIIFSFLFDHSTLDDLIRVTKNGLVQGEKRINSLYPDESFLAFHGIPYADSPVGERRFMHPRAHSNWSDIYDASNSDHKYKCCPQVDISIT